MNCRYFKYLFS